MTTGDVDPVFIDSNILVYANVASAPFHARAVNALQELNDEGIDLWVSRQVLREFLATLTRPQAFAAPQPISVLIQDVRSFESQFYVAEDGPDVTARLLALLNDVPAGGKQIHDANIVATMQAHGIRRLLTGNGADFARYSRHITVLPL